MLPRYLPTTVVLLYAQRIQSVVLYLNVSSYPEKAGNYDEFIEEQPDKDVKFSSPKYYE